VEMILGPCLVLNVSVHPVIPLGMSSLDVTANVIQLRRDVLLHLHTACTCRFDRDTTVEVPVTIRAFSPSKLEEVAATAPRSAGVETQGADLLMRRCDRIAVEIIEDQVTGQSENVQDRFVAMDVAKHTRCVRVVTASATAADRLSRTKITGSHDALGSADVVSSAGKGRPKRKLRERHRCSKSFAITSCSLAATSSAFPARMDSSGIWMMAASLATLILEHCGADSRGPDLERIAPLMRAGTDPFA
jgi:hypothetical protein